MRIITRHTLPPEFKWKYVRCAYVQDDADDDYVMKLALGLHDLTKGEINQEKSGPWAWATSKLPTRVMHIDIGDESELCVVVNVSDDSTLWDPVQAALIWKG